MLKIEGRESAHVQSRVKDLSKVPNVVSYTALLAAITPISKLNRNEDDLYSPVLIRDTDSLIANFGDPRIDPKKYIDLYTIMQLVADGTSCYVAKVPSGDSGIYEINLISNAPAAAITMEVVEDTDNKVWKSTAPVENTPNIIVVNDDEDVIEFKSYSYDDSGYLTLEFETAPSSVNIAVVGDRDLSMIAYSSMDNDITLECSLSQAKPLSLKAFYLNVAIKDNGNTLATAKVKLDESTTNQGLVNAIDSVIGSYVSLELTNPEYASACELNDNRDKSIVTQLLDKYAAHPNLAPGDPGYDAENPQPNRSKPRADLATNPTELTNASTTLSVPKFEVTLSAYEKTLKQFKDKKYAGCMMADLTAPKHVESNGVVAPGAKFGVPSSEERRTIHYFLKEIAAERKDTTVLLSAPYMQSVENTTPYTFDEVCDWVSANSSFSDLWEYGASDTTDYATQSFYLEMYYSWLDMKCTKMDNGIAKSEVVRLAPSGVVMSNIIKSFRERGVHLPVAGDQAGVISDLCSVVKNPTTKAERDQLIQYRINPIWDTGTRGIQIYGNETLNAGYTDLNAAHIARTLVNIRSKVDEYTETLKFSINNPMLWDRWKNYVSMYILEPLKSVNALAKYTVAMGSDTTTAEEMANRMARGKITLVFYQSAEIFDLEFTVLSSATAFD